ncbi:MAG: hypothetical protein M3R00_03785 [Pseudomonadota bacterium]|nr:hypothetical protein [Pseudomonadota bacterium]
MNKNDRWTIFASKHGLQKAICAEYDNIALTLHNTAECTTAIFEFIRRRAQEDIDAFLAATKLHPYLKLQCFDASLKDFWQGLKENAFSTEVIPF